MQKDDLIQKRQNQLEEDLQFILSSIRARQNGLIFFLQRYKNSISKNLAQFKLSKNQYQQKQKIYTNQIAKMIIKHSQSSTGNLYPVRAFWVKLKTIIKVSIDRISSLNIPHLQKLNECYQKALSAITRSSDGQKSLLAFKEVQNYFKKRNIQTLLLGRQNFVSPSSISYSQSKIQKNRSQTLFKPQAAISRFTIQNQDSHVYSKGQTMNLIKDRMYGIFDFNGLTGIQEQQNKLSQPKIKSLNRIKNRRPQQAIKANILNFIKVEQLGKLKSSSKASQKYIKKINKHVEKYQKNFQGAFDGKYEVGTLLDKKKTIFQNIYLLYDNLFAKNIPNHKMISKFMFNTTKINQLIYNAYEKKKKLGKKQKQKNQGKDQKQKEIVSQKRLNQQKQKNFITKSNKINRKLHSAKDFHQSQNAINNLTTKQYIREKKQSQLTAITSKHSNYQKDFFVINLITQKRQKGEKLDRQKGQRFDKQKYQKYDKEKGQKHDKQHIQKTDKQKQKEKKILRSKTAKIKISNSQINTQNYHLQSFNPHIQNFQNNNILGKHFVSQNQGNKQSQSIRGLQRFSKIIVANN